MEEKSLQVQITELNQKVDLILDHVNQQRLETNKVEDLFADLSIIGKDVYDTAVEELDNRMVNIDPDQVKSLILRILRNIENMNNFLEIFESMNDFLKDASPIFNEVVIDLSKKLHQLDQKGYFEFSDEILKLVDKIITHYSAEDIKALSGNIVNIMDTLGAATKPEVLAGLDHTITTYKNIDTKNIPEYSIFKVVREMNKPEMKRAMGFFITFMKSMAAKTNINN